MPVLIILFLLSLVFFFGNCSEDERVEQKQKSFFVVEPIGEPIIPQFIEKNTTEVKSSNLAKEQVKSIDKNATRISNERIIEEGIVVNGVPINLEENSSQEIIPSRLPPIEEGSEFTQILFRDLTDFKYEVNWESDGKVFDFASYAKRVPKEVREKTGKFVAVEGFMIPTIVNENNLVKEFLLLPDQMSCCFGQTPEPNGWVVVSSQEGVEVLMDEVIRVIGQITIEERWDEEFFVGLYHLNCDEIVGPSL